MITDGQDKKPKKGTGLAGNGPLSRVNTTNCAFDNFAHGKSYPRCLLQDDIGDKHMAVAPAPSLTIEFLVI
jgi:hypothetical protein